MSHSFVFNRQIFLRLVVVFFFLSAHSASALTVSGTLYSDEGLTTIASGKTIKIAVGTSTPATVYTTTTDGSSNFSFTFSSLTATTSLVLWVDATTSIRAALFTMATSSSNSISGLDLYQNRLILAAQSTSTLTTTNMAFYDGDDDSDIQYTANGGVLTVAAGQELHLASGTTFAPSGTLTLHGNAGSGTDGSLHLTGSSTYRTAYTTAIAGDLLASTTATIDNTSVLSMTASTTGKSISAPSSSSLGNLSFTGSGSWSFATNATTTSLLINAGASVTAPADNLTVQGLFNNNGTFTHNNGTTTMQSIREGILDYLAGRDVSGDGSGTGSKNIYSLALSGTTLYVGTYSDATACSQVAGSAIGCELQVYDVSSSTNPIYVAGRDVSGSSNGTGSNAIWTLTTIGNTLYVGTYSDATACSQTPGSAIGCELQVYRAGTPLALAGTHTNTSAFHTLDTRSAMGIGVSASTTRYVNAGMVEVGAPLSASTLLSNTGTLTLTVPVTLGGDYVNTGVVTHASTFTLNGTTQSLSGTMTGASLFNDLVIAGSGTKTISAPTASTTHLTIQSGATLVAPSGTLTISGSMVNNGTYTHNTGTVDMKTYITNYLAGRDVSGSSNGTGSNYINSLALSGTTLYVGTYSDATACSQTPGSAIGCELQVYDVSSSTNPIYVAGRDVSGSSNGTGSNWINTLTTIGNTLYVGTGGDATACSQVAGSTIGCELQVYDVSSSTNPIYVAGRDISGSSNGTGSNWINTLTTIGNTLYVGTGGDATACSQVAGSTIGCELQVYDVSSSTNPIYVAGRDISGSSSGTGSNDIYTLTTMGNTLFMGTGGDSTACSQVAGSAIGCELQIYGLQTMGGTMTGTSAFNNVKVTGAGTRFTAPFTASGNFTATTPGSKIVFAPAATSTVGNFVVAGASGNEISLLSGTPGVRWNIAVTGTSTVSMVRVQDSHACAPSGTIYAASSTDLGNNLCWIFAGPQSPTISLFAYLFRNDDAGESSATLHGTESSTSSDRVWKGDRLRLRLGISNTGTGAATNYQYRLQYSSTSCTVWSDVLPYASSSSLGEWKMDPSQWFTDGTLTQNLSIITDPNGKSFVPGELRFLSNLTGALTLSTSQFTELEYAISSTALVTPGAVYCFRLVDQTLNTSFTYGVQPQILLTTRPRPQTGGAAIEDVGSGPIVTGGGSGGGGASEGTGSGGAVGGGGAGGGGGLE